MPPPVYRYDAEEYEAGRVIASRGDHRERLTDKQKVVEDLIRARMFNGHIIRATSLYVWKDIDVAVAAWRRTTHGEHLYELSVDPADVIRTGDVSLYSFAIGVDPTETALNAYVRQYCAEVYTRPRIELMVSKATVTRRLYHSSEK